MNNVTYIARLRVLLIIGSICISLSVHAGMSTNKTINFIGIPVTGQNSLLGVSPIDYGTLSGVDIGQAGFHQLGEFDPYNTFPRKLNPDTPLSAVLSTTIDLEFLSDLDLSESIIRNNMINVKLNDVEIITSIDGSVRHKLPSIFKLSTIGIGKASLPNVNKDITLQRWLDARSKLQIECNDNQTTELELRANKLLPLSLYSINANVVIEGEGIKSLPLGGLSNLVTTDFDGNARYERTLKKCILDEFYTAKGKKAKVMNVTIVYHSDTGSYGALTHAAFSEGVIDEQENIGNLNYFPGTVSHVHIEIPLTGTIADNRMSEFVKEILE